MKMNENGRSMIEMLGVLAIVGVLSVGGIAGYSKAMSKFRINKTNDQVTQIVTAVRTLFGTQKDYSALGTANNYTLITKASLMPDEMLTMNAAGNIATAATNAFGGNVTLVYGKRTANDTNKAFVLTFFGVPEDACIDLATQDWGSGSSSGLVAMSIATGASATSLDAKYAGCSDNTATIVCGGKGPMSVSNATATCSGANNVVSWKFY